MKLVHAKDSLIDLRMRRDNYATRIEDMMWDPYFHP
jgi:hypothetical protein